MTSWKEIYEDLVFRVEIDFKFRLDEKDDGTIFDDVKRRYSPRRKGAKRRKLAKQPDLDSGSSDDSSTASVDSGEMEEWQDNKDKWTDKEINKPYWNTVPRCSIVPTDSPPPVGLSPEPQACALPIKTSTTLTCPALTSASPARGLAFRPPRSGKSCSRFMPSRISLTTNRKTQNITGRSTTAGSTRTPHPSTSPRGERKALLTVGFNTRANIEANPPRLPPLTTVPHLLALWFVFREAIRRRTNVARPSNASQKNQDAQTVCDEFYAATTETELQAQADLQIGVNDFKVQNKALNATVFQTHNANISTEKVAPWLEVTTRLYALARSFELNDERLLDVLPPGTAARGSYADFRAVLGV
ncbi:MAG: hypothetical protein M1816_005395 [Peltula sp. TS41687]|nr:MAG: hypothetical protein M1816_005395 [Peltula sp. TS41687]